MKRKKPDPMAEAFRVLEPILANPSDFPAHLVVIPAGSPILAKLFSREPSRIIQYLRDHGPVSSIRELADVLGRDPAAVSRDVRILERHGLVETVQSGREKTLSATQRPILVA